MNAHSGNNANNRKGGIAALVICGIVIIALLGVIIVLLLRRGGNEEAAANSATSGSLRRSVVVSQQNAEQVVEDLLAQEYVEPGYYTVSMNNVWNFATGDSVSEDAFVANLQKNTNDVYFDVFIEGDEENAIYMSPVLPRGSELDSIKLDKVLEAGTYNCVMIYHLVDENQDTLSTLRVGMTIVIRG